MDRLQDANYTVNPLKCEWAVQETDFLGHWLTPSGLKPWRKKIQAILDLQAPATTKQLRSFIGAINYYRDLFPRRAHIMAPLTSLTSKPFKWGSVEEEAFRKVKSIIAVDCMCRYPDLNEPFHVYTDASDYQLGAVIMQQGMPVAYYSRKLTSAQRNYATYDKEMLSILETFREFRDILYGARELHVYTDHKNMTYDKISSQRLLRWRLEIEEYGPQFHYIQGEKNVLADAFSRIPVEHSELLRDRLNKPEPTPDGFFSVTDDTELFDCFLNFPSGIATNPLSLETIREEQITDTDLQRLPLDYPNQFQVIDLHGVPLVCHTKSPQHPWKIVIPNSILDDTVRWYHQFLNHIGQRRLIDTISAHHWHPDLSACVKQHVSTCDSCQHNKHSGPGYGLLPPREAALVPWEEVNVDLIGPWSININGEEVKFRAFTCIDPVTNLTEIVRVDNTRSKHVAAKFEQSWLSRYPRPDRCVYDRGSEFVGLEFQRLLRQAQIKDKPISAKNPQANAICERMHQSVGNILRTLLRTHTPTDYDSATELVDSALATATHSLRSTVHGTLQMSPGAIVFNRDMLLNIPLIADLHAMQQRRQKLIDDNLIRANSKRRSKDYQPNDQVLILHEKDQLNKLDDRSYGPFPITRIHTNGTVDVQMKPNVTQTINIRRIRPYKS